MSLSVLSSVNVSLLNNRKILLSRRAHTGWMDGSLCIPGGHVEPGETPRQAAVRELREELAIEVGVGDLEFACVAVRNTEPNQYVAYEFVIRDKDIAYENAEPNKCSELVWVGADNLPNDVIADFREIVSRSIMGKEKYLELGF